MTDEVYVIDLRRKRQEIKNRISNEEALLKQVNEEIKKHISVGEEVIADGLVTRVLQKHRKKYNEDEIRAKIGQVRWNQITRRVLVEDLLTDAIINGKIDPAEIAPFVDEEPWGEPYVEVRKAAKPEESDA